MNRNVVRRLVPLLLVLALAAATEAQASGKDLVERPATLGMILTYQRPAHGGDGWIVARKILPAGPAEKAGLLPGDLVTAIDGKPLRFEDDRALLLGLAATLRAGAKLSLRVVRKERAMNVIIIPVRMSDAHYEQWKATVDSLRPKRIPVPPVTESGKQ